MTVCKRERSYLCSSSSSKRLRPEQSISFESLPAEIYEAIFSKLPISAVRHLSLVSHALLPHTEKFLYRRLSVSTSSRQSVRKLLRTLLLHPNLAALVREMDYNVSICCNQHSEQGLNSRGLFYPNSRNKGLNTERISVSAGGFSNGARKAYISQICSLYHLDYPNLQLEDELKRVTCEAHLCALVRSLCPRLQGLNIKCNPMTWSHIFTPFNPEASPMLGLHSVTRLTVQNTGILFANQDAHAFWSSLGSIFASPSLQGLRISNLEVVDSSPPSDSDVLFPNSCLETQSNFTSLVFKDCTIAASSLRVLLSSTQLPIKHISISLPHFFLNQHASSVALCPWADLSSALQPIRSTLQVLELHASAVWWHHQALSKKHAHDLLAPIPSLKDFRMLRALKVPFRAIISIDDDECGISVAERLPDDLEEIWFADDGFPAEFSVLFKNLGFVRRIFEDKQKERLSKLKRVVLLGRGWDNEWENGAIWKSVGEEIGIEIKMVKQFKDRRYSEVNI